MPINSRMSRRKRTAITTRVTRVKIRTKTKMKMTLMVIMTSVP